MSGCSLSAFLIQADVIHSRSKLSNQPTHLSHPGCGITPRSPLVSGLSCDKDTTKCGAPLIKSDTACTPVASRS
ncbi:hypothetical protein BDR03DRAFT_940691 [Suillus americanus]|nr:hypothetical protein BDR03DRAFT_940691 [Suillus americanus]